MSNEGQNFRVNPFLVGYPQNERGTWLLVNFYSKENYAIDRPDIAFFLLGSLQESDKRGWGIRIAKELNFPEPKNNEFHIV